MNCGFECPRCGHSTLEEILESVTLSSEVIEADEEECEYGRVSWDGGRIDRYQCKNCGWVVPDCKDVKTLYEWLDDEKELNNGQG